MEHVATEYKHKYQCSIKPTRMLVNSCATLRTYRLLPKNIFEYNKMIFRNDIVRLFYKILQKFCENTVCIPSVQATMVC
jgi:hypothetical protein